MELAITKPKRSMKLKPSEWKRLKAMLNEMTPLQASMVLGVYRETIIRVALIGSGAEKTIIKIRQNLPK